MNVKQLQDKDGTDFQPNTPDKTGYPDFTTRTLKTWESQFTADQDGWVTAYSQNGSDIEQHPRLLINGQFYDIIAGGKSYMIGTTIICPIKKGDTYKAERGRTDTSRELFFYSIKTNTDNGGGFDTLMLSTTLNTMGVVA